MPGRPMAEFLRPGHPLLDTVVDIVTAHDGGTLLQGALLVDDQDPGDTPRLLLFLEHAITDSRSGPSGQPHIVSRRFEFVTVDPSGRREPAGPAPYLDCRAATADEMTHVTRHLDQSWLGGGVDQAGLDYAIETLVPQHLGEVRGQTEARVDKVAAAVHARLTAAINYWDRRATELSEQARAGRQPRMNPDRARARADELSDRLQRRMAELEQERRLQALPPVVVGAALIVPAALVRPATEVGGDVIRWARQTAEVERRALDAVKAAEHALKRVPHEMPHNNPGYDIESEDGGRHIHFIEVKGRIAGADTVIVTRTEVLTGLNAADRYVLALVEVGPDGHDEVRYLRDPFAGKSERLHFAETSTVFDWGKLWAVAGAPS